MRSLFYKEVGAFFSSLTGYLVIAVFLLANSLLLWVLPGNWNIADRGYASLAPMFEIAPWVFMFLVASVTMRLISDEKKQGTLELLFTKPLSESHIVLAKYFAAILLIILSIVPTLLFFCSVYLLGNPVGIIDTGGTYGAYLGLFFLAAIYAAIGLFASCLTDNQIFSFIIAVVISLLMFVGFDALAGIPFFSGMENGISNLGINAHYKSISRGILDSRDMLYFTGASAIFLLLSRLVLQSRKW